MTTGTAEHGHCKDLLERLSRYLDDELPPQDRSSLEEHLRACPECKQVLHSLEHTVDLCREQGHPDLPPDVRARALQRVHQLLESTPLPIPRKRR
jgi:anti-sigma factor (TIGR02949 family)